MEDSTLLYIASTYGFIRSRFIRSRLFTNNNKRRLKRDILSVSEANISVSEANTNALHSQEVETIIREIIYEVIDEVISEASLSVSEASLSVSEAMKASLSESINIDDSWYGFDNLKIYHCHIPIISNELSDSGDDF